MLPYSPLHHLLLADFGAPLVATSGNVSGEPVLTDNAMAETRLGADRRCLSPSRPPDRSAGRRSGLSRHRRQTAAAPAGTRQRAARNRICPSRSHGRCWRWAVNSRIPSRWAGASGPSCRRISATWTRRAASHCSQQVAADLQSLYGVTAESRSLRCPSRLCDDAARAAVGSAGEQIFHHAPMHRRLPAKAIKPTIGWFLPGTAPAIGARWNDLGRRGAARPPGPLASRGDIAAVRAARRRPRGARAVAQRARFVLGSRNRVARCAQETRSLAPCLEAKHQLPADLIGWPAVRRRRPPCSVLSRRRVMRDRRRVTSKPSAPSDAEPISAASSRRSDGIWESDWSPLLHRLQDASKASRRGRPCFMPRLPNCCSTQARRCAPNAACPHFGLTGGVFQNRVLCETCRSLCAVRRLHRPHSGTSALQRCRLKLRADH